MLKGGIQGKSGSGNHPKKRPLTGTIRLKDIIGNNLSEYLPRDQQTKREGGEGALESSKIR